MEGHLKLPLQSLKRFFLFFSYKNIWYFTIVEAWKSAKKSSEICYNSASQLLDQRPKLMNANYVAQLPIAGLNLNHFSDFQLNIKKCLELMIQIWTLDIFMSAKNFDTLFKIDLMSMLSLNPSKTHKQFSLQYWVTDSFEKEGLQREKR